MTTRDGRRATLTDLALWIVICIVAALVGGLAPMVIPHGCSGPACYRDKLAIAKLSTLDAEVRK